VRGQILDWDFCFEHERGTFWLVAAVCASDSGSS